MAARHILAAGNALVAKYRHAGERVMPKACFQHDRRRGGLRPGLRTSHSRPGFSPAPPQSRWLFETGQSPTDLEGP